MDKPTETTRDHLLSALGSLFMATEPAAHREKIAEHIKTALKLLTEDGKHVEGA